MKSLTNDNVPKHVRFEDEVVKVLSIMLNITTSDAQDILMTDNVSDMMDDAFSRNIHPFLIAGRIAVTTKKD